jgi:hypothetical protein
MKRLPLLLFAPAMLVVLYVGCRPESVPEQEPEIKQTEWKPWTEPWTDEVDEQEEITSLVGTTWEGRDSFWRNDVSFLFFPSDSEVTYYIVYKNGFNYHGKGTYTFKDSTLDIDIPGCLFEPATLENGVINMIKFDTSNFTPCEYRKL